MSEAPDETTGEEPAPPGLVGRVIRGALAVLALIGVGIVAGGGAVVYPYLRADMALDRVVRAVALEWRDFGRDKAVEKLRYELDHEQVETVAADACDLDEVDGGKRVACHWAVQIALPVGSVPLSFSSVAVIDPTGDLR